MKSSNSSSFSSFGLHFDAPRPVDEVGSSVSGMLAVMGVSSKLTRTAFFFLPDPPSDVVSDASLGAPLLPKRPFCDTGDVPRLDTEGDDFRADLAGEMERSGGWCLTPASSTATGAKCALRGGLRLCPRSLGARTLPLPGAARVLVVVGTTGVARRGYELSWFGWNLGDIITSMCVGCTALGNCRLVLACSSG
jgi:hypothetical protein